MSSTTRESPKPPVSTEETTRPQVSSEILELLLIETVPLAIRVTKELEDLGLPKGSGEADKSVFDHPGGVEFLETPYAEHNDVLYRIETYGFNVGKRIAEVLSQEADPFHEPLDVMKFLCRDVWKALYGKQMDNLRTNHRGTFMLVDNEFKMFESMSVKNKEKDLVRKAQPYLHLPCGIIKGILDKLGIPAIVVADCQQAPVVNFNIRTNLQS